MRLFTLFVAVKAVLGSVVFFNEVGAAPVSLGTEQAVIGPNTSFHFDASTFVPVPSGADYFQISSIAGPIRFSGSALISFGEFTHPTGQLTALYGLFDAAGVQSDPATPISGALVTDAELFPAIGTLFGIGDGRTGFQDPSAPIQSFFVPNGASVLRLGHQDAIVSDNSGSLTVVVEFFRDGAQVPAPALWLPMVAMVLALRLKRQPRLFAV